jgi:nucleoid DNA-binding protein
MQKRHWLAYGVITGSLGLILGWSAPVLSQKAGPVKDSPRKPAVNETFNQRVAKGAKLSAEEVARVLKALGPVIREDLAKGQSVNLPDLGSFRIVRVEKHKDLVDGVPTSIPASNYVEFIPSGGLSEAANGANVTPADSIPAFQYVPLPGQTPSQKTDYLRISGRRPHG